LGDSARKPQPRAHRAHDSTGILTVYAALLVFIPAALIVAPLGGSGSPAQLFALLVLVTWAAFRLKERHTRVRSRLVVCFLLFLAAIGASFIAAMTRPINPLEASVVNLGVLAVAGWAGVFLAAAEGISSMQRLIDFGRRLVTVGAVVATIGLAQWITKQPLVDAIQIPGLSATRPVFGVAVREGFSRPAGTATHPIEFGVVIAMLLPLALHFALEDRSRSWLRRWTPAIIILAMVPLSLSRSTIVCTTAAAIVLLPAWPKARRRAALLFASLGGVVVFLTIPGLSGSLLGLFTSVSGDTSLTSRTDSYGVVWDFFLRSPIFGRGFGSFLPSYRILDNQLLLLLVEVGIFGLVSCVAVLALGVAAPIRARRRMTEPVTRSFAQSLAASIAAGAFGFATFDLLSFPIAAGLVFLLLGLAAALDRLVQPPLELAHMVSIPARGRGIVAVVAIGLVLTCAVAVRTYRAGGDYFASSFVTLVLPTSLSQRNALSESSTGLVETAGVLARDTDLGLAGAVVGDVSLLDMGISQGAMVRQLNHGGQWASDFTDPFVNVQVVDRSPDAVVQRMDAMVAQLRDDLDRRESSFGVRPDSRIRLLVSPVAPRIIQATGHRTLATAAVLLLGFATTAAVGAWMLGRKRRDSAQEGVDVP
jgi:O-antigen ligase